MLFLCNTANTKALCSKPRSIYSPRDWVSLLLNGDYKLKNECAMVKCVRRVTLKVLHCIQTQVNVTLFLPASASKTVCSQPFIIACRETPGNSTAELHNFKTHSFGLCSTVGLWNEDYWKEKHACQLVETGLSGSKIGEKNGGLRSERK